MRVSSLEKLFNSRKIWRASHQLPPKNKGINSGFPQLNCQLPHNGWPSAGLTELLCDQAGIGELSLLSPALAQLSQQAGWIVWVDPPYTPYPPALAQQGFDLRRTMLIHTQSQAEQLWTLETLLKADYCHAALFWPKRYSTKALRRLHMAASQGKSWGIAFRPISSQAHASPAPLRIRLSHSNKNVRSNLQQTNVEQTGLEIEIIKRPGNWASETFCVPIQQQLRQHQAYSANTPHYQTEKQRDQQPVIHHNFIQNKTGCTLPLEEKTAEKIKQPTQNSVTPFPPL
ncbi:MAG: translesion DNA synthesis-associated protein ImuA [Pseudomonadales bacterium]|nr:translesion DNA synthesis-associated protein ImuA [Pseudomonadales bacterium]